MGSFSWNLLNSGIHRKSRHEQENPAIKAGFSPFRKCCPKFYCDSPFVDLIKIELSTLPGSVLPSVPSNSGSGDFLVF